jgi:AraC-like DNA-binding protein
MCSKNLFLPSAFTCFFVLLVSFPLEGQVKNSVKENIEKLHQQAKEGAYTDPEKALSIAEMALSQSQEYGLEKEEMQSYYCMGLIYYYKSYYNISNDYYRLVTKSAQDPKQLSAAWNNMGINFETLGMLDSALFAYQESIKIDKAQGDTKSEHMGLINIGLLNSKVNRYDLAFSQTFKAKAYFQETKDLQNLGLCYLNLGVFYDFNGKSDSCIANYEQAAKIFGEVQDYPNQTLAYLSLSGFWVRGKQYAKAREIFNRAKELPSASVPYYAASLNATLSLIYEGIGKADSAIYFSRMALIGFDTLGVLARAKEEYFSLANLYAVTGRSPEYNRAIQQYDSLSKVLLNEDMNERIAEMEIRYKLDVKNLQIKNAETELRKNRIQIVVISIFSLALLVALILTYRLYSKVKFANKNLYKKNIELLATERSKMFEQVSLDTNVEQNVLLNRFKKLMEEQAFFKKPELSLKMAAMELGTNEKYLSQAINRGDDNFNTYVNRFRVNEARRIILEEQQDNISIEELGLMVGFSNRHTFSRAFTLITGISPSEFRRIHLSSNIS